MRFVAALVGILALSAGSRAVAQSAPGVALAPSHALVGTIVRIDGDTLTLRLRNGREQQVDAGPALAAGAYSAPLFIGKAIVVEGAFDSHGVVRATTITKLAKPDETAAPDR